jgi:hypothetical protein
LINWISGIPTENQLLLIMSSAQHWSRRDTTKAASFTEVQRKCQLTSHTLEDIIGNSEVLISGFAMMFGVIIFALHVHLRFHVAALD